MPTKDIALIGLLLLFAVAVVGLVTLWNILKAITGFWDDYRRVNQKGIGRDDD